MSLENKVLLMTEFYLNFIEIHHSTVVSYDLILHFFVYKWSKFHSAKVAKYVSLSLIVKWSSIQFWEIMLECDKFLSCGVKMS